MNETVKNLLVKYITGQADETESAEVKEWIRSKPEHEKYYIELYEAWHNSFYANQDLIDVDQAYLSFLKKTTIPFYKKTTFWSKMAVAACLMLACIAGLYRYQKNRAFDSMVTLSVPKGAKRKLTLPDGSLVWVNAGSQITYSKNFGEKNRTIYLKGEAYFDIAPAKTNIPFLVKTDRFTIRDVGTVFNVKAYPDENVFETAVVEGKVSVEGKINQRSGSESKVFLDANQVLSINTHRVNAQHSSPELNKHLHAEPVKVLQIDPQEVNEYNGWKEDVLVFDGDTFEDIMRVLERRYDVKILIADESLKNLKYVGTFKNIRSISAVLKVIEETTPITCHTEGSQITIDKDQ
ncbi:FecR family protein [Desertivirga xinjiangensis]|uniref:FecR family protein n=1 Tax=Desertivirga xinjiangensis TaxID=539206 RepID=UPI002108AD9E|nr:FecR family protein [Pedobacter xinjiangensis]